jgi:imidazolonepropionase-like amidohydrolase
VAGSAVKYGLSKEQALAAVTLNAAKIIGIDGKTGSIEVGKDANIVISEGDLLDVATNQVSMAFIQGRNVNLDDKQKYLNRKFTEKYGVK